MLTLPAELDNGERVVFNDDYEEYLWKRTSGDQNSNEKRSAQENKESNNQNQSSQQPSTSASTSSATSSSSITSMKNIY